MATGEEEPEIIECELRLHSGLPAGKENGEFSWAEWSETAVGHPVIFSAVAVTGKGLWNGPLSPGVGITAPLALDDPFWTIFLPDSSGVPVMTGQVGHPLAIGETFSLPPGQPGVWTANVIFEGAIVVE